MKREAKQERSPSRERSPRTAVAVPSEPKCEAGVSTGKAGKGKRKAGESTADRGNGKAADGKGKAGDGKGKADGKVYDFQVTEGKGRPWTFSDVVAVVLRVLGPSRDPQQLRSSTNA